MTGSKAQRTLATPLAIVGMGCLFPKADGPATFWANIAAGLDCVGNVPSSHWRSEDYFADDPAAADMTYARRGAFLEPFDFDPLRYGLNPRGVEATDTTQILGLAVAEQALRDAGYAIHKEDDTGRPFDRRRTSCILGVTGALELVIPLGARLGHPIWRRALRDAGVDAVTADEVVRRIASAYVPWQENSFPGLLGNVAAGRIANRFDLGGTNCVVDAACASSLSAIHMAAMELAAGRADMVVSGGLDTFNDIFMYMCFSKTPALSPTGDARPFSAAADGTILGEGLGVLVLKRLDDARRDGDRIHAILRGIGSSSDGLGNAVYAPSADGQKRALRAAYEAAGVSPATIELVEAHGTGTKVGDAAELEALVEVYREAGNGEPWCALGSVKSMIGHTKAAAGVAGVIKAVLALERKVLPPSIKIDRPAERLSAGDVPLYVNTEKRPWLPRREHPRRAAVSAFGFGGSNFHCVLEEADAAAGSIDFEGGPALLALAADDRAALGERLRGLKGISRRGDLRAEAARRTREFRPDAPCRLVLVIPHDGDAAAQIVDGAERMLAERADAGHWSTPRGAFFGSGPQRGKLAVLFPGQGSQFVGMLRDLACRFPVMLETLDAADRAFGPTAHGQRLSDHVFPVPTFTYAERVAQQERLRDTRVAQPALGAVSLGAWRVLEHFAVAAEAAAGHSFGELVALCAAGCFDAGALHQLAVARGELLANCGGKTAGGMLAVAADADVVQRALDKERLALTLANHNGPAQCVVSGAIAEIERAKALFGQQGLSVRRLAVSGAFHSPLVAEAEASLAEVLRTIDWSNPRLPVYANTTAAIYPHDSDAARRLLAGQLAHGVQFVAQIDAMYADGVRTFVEVGPGRTLSGLVQAILGGREHEAIALDAIRGEKPGIEELAKALARLAAAGHAIDLTKWDEGFADRSGGDGKKPAMVIPLTGANYFKPPEPEPPKTPRIEQKERAEVTGMNQNEPQRATANVAQPAAVPDGQLAAALATTQETLLLLDRLRQETARVQQQYLDGQLAAQQTIARLVEQQHQLLAASLGLNLPAPASAPPTEVIETPRLQPVEPQSPVHATPPIHPAPQHAAAEAPENVAQVRQPQPRIAAETPAAPAPPQPRQTSSAAPVLLAVIADKTGYPAEMLELDMRLDTDLGIDSIKRVEILSALQERLPEAPAAKPEDLGRLGTLREIVDFLAAEARGEEPAAMPSERTVFEAEEPFSQPASASGGEAEAALLEVIADKTGYPVEMLELDMRLDTDLGIDSIKRVEILSALQERLPEAPTIGSERLGELQTLRDVAALLGATAVTATETAAMESTDEPTSVAMSPPVEVEPDELPAAQQSLGPLDRRVVVAVPLDIEPPRERVALPPGATVWIADDGQGLAAAVANHLRAIGIAPRIVPLDSQPAVDESLAGLILLPPVKSSSRLARDAWQLLRTAAPALRQKGQQGGALLVGVSRLDGQFGFGGQAIGEVETAAIAGLVKTARHEWPDVSSKTIDLPADMEPTSTLIDVLVDEMFRCGPLEVGITDQGRWTTRLVEQPQAPASDSAPLEPRDLVVMSGGARGITAAAAIALAKAWRPTLLLLGRSPEPEPEPPWLKEVTSEAAMKRAIAENAPNKLTPRELEAEYRRHVANREVQATLRRIEASGAKAVYREVDVRRADDVARVIAEVRQQYGPVRGLIHGAGVLADRRIEEKTAEQFESVYSTKVDGAEALLSAVSEDDLRVLAMFSSSTARFGRTGQCDYAAANEVLNKRAQAEARRRPSCRVASINWGPWQGGMVTPELARLFSSEGIGIIPLHTGARHLVDEIAQAAGGPVETVVLGPESAVAGEVFQPVDTVPPCAAPPVEPAAPAAAPSERGMYLAFRRELSIDEYPFLRSHVIGGRAVLPMVMTIEWLAHGAMHENPGLLFHGFDDLQILKGVMLEPDARVPIEVVAGQPTSEGGLEIVPVELRSGTTRHARARVVLAAELPPAPEPSPSPLLPSEPTWECDPYTGGTLFHGPEFQGITSIEGGSDRGIVGWAQAAPPPSAWMRRPLRGLWLADPLVLDSAFQMVVLWCAQCRGALSLPTGVSNYRQYRRLETPARVLARVMRHTEYAAEATMEFHDAGGRLAARMEGYKCVIDRSLAEAFARNKLVEGIRSEA